MVARFWFGFACALVAGCNHAGLPLAGDGGADLALPLAIDGGPDSARPGCRSQRDCPAGQPIDCVPPGAILCGGPACPPSTPCNNDSFCQANGGAPNLVCDVPECPCGGGPICIPGCASPSDCRQGLTCDPSHHCVPILCGACPAHFVCGTSGACERQSCIADSDCGSGFCVVGGCYDSLGTCSPIPA